MEEHFSVLSEEHGRLAASKQALSLEKDDLVKVSISKCSRSQHHKVLPQI